MTKPTGRGGKREGAGRPQDEVKAIAARAQEVAPRKGGHPTDRETLSREDANSKADRLIGRRLNRLIKNLIELADGISVKETSDDGTTKVYTRPPDFKANQYLIDRILGRPKQAIEHSGSGGGAITIKVEYADADPDPASAPSGTEAGAVGPETL